MMRCNPESFDSILFTGALIGGCQSIMWMVLTMCAMLTHRCVLRMPEYENDNFVLTTIVKFYFEGDGCKVNGTQSIPDISKVNITTPGEVFSWMIAFFFITTFQLVLSLLLIKVRSKGGFLKEWCFITFTLAIMDIVFSSSFVIDYLILKDYLYKNQEEKDKVISAPLAMFIISARGYFLWLINVAFVIYYVVWISRYSKEKKSNELIPNKKMGEDNRGFNTFFDSLVIRGDEWGDLSEERVGGRFPLSCDEAVTAFNESEDEKVDMAKRNAGKFVCDCRQTQNRMVNVPPEQLNLAQSKQYDAFTSELKERLTIRAKTKRKLVNDSGDFNHDIRNFRPGKGLSQTKPVPIGHVPEAPPLPAVTTSSKSSFY